MFSLYKNDSINGASLKTFQKFSEHHGIIDFREREREGGREGERGHLWQEVATNFNSQDFSLILCTFRD